MCELNCVKCSWLFDVYERFKYIKANYTDAKLQDNIECIEQTLTKILILDQIVLIAAEKTIAGCSCSRNGDGCSSPQHLE